jgi:hypothetical protein
MAPRRWQPGEVVRLLEAVDRCLDEPFRLIVIGGGAISVGYAVDIATEDIDAFETSIAVISEAVDRARDETGLAIPLTAVGVAEMPYNYQDRLRRVLPHLERLEVLVPNEHDLVLSKLARGRENDFLHIEELHRKHPLDMDVLIERHESELDHIASVRTRSGIRLNPLECIERLWGELALKRAERALTSPPG